MTTTMYPLWSIVIGGGLLLVVVTVAVAAVALATAGRRKDE